MELAQPGNQRRILSLDLQVFGREGAKPAKPQVRQTMCTGRNYSQYRGHSYASPSKSDHSNLCRMSGRSWEAGPCGRIPPSAASGGTPECFCSSNCSRRRCKNPFRWPQRQGRPRPVKIWCWGHWGHQRAFIKFQLHIFMVAHGGAKRLRSYTSHQSQCKHLQPVMGSAPLFAEQKWRHLDFHDFPTSKASYSPQVELVFHFSRANQTIWTIRLWHDKMCICNFRILWYPVLAWQLIMT